MREAGGGGGEGDERTADFLRRRAPLWVVPCTSLCGVARAMAACVSLEIRAAMRGAPGRTPPRRLT